MLTKKATEFFPDRTGNRCHGCNKPFSAANMIRGYCKHCAARTKEIFHCPTCQRNWVADWISVSWAVKCEINSCYEECFYCKGLIPERD